MTRNAKETNRPLHASTREVAFVVPHRYFCSMSEQTLKKLIVPFLLLQLLVVGPLEYSHSDFVGSPSSSSQSLSRHDCGPRELHKNLSEQHFCLPCYRITTIVACLNLPPVIPAAAIRTLFPAQSRIILVQDLNLQILKRGPPPHSV